MFAFAPDPNQPKAEMYADLVGAAQALIHGESDGVANMANVAALIWQFLPRLNWSGFYRTVGTDELVLGPFIGSPPASGFPLAKASAARRRRARRPSWCPMSMPSPVISPAMPTAARNWWCRCCGMVR